MRKWRVQRKRSEKTLDASQIVDAILDARGFSDEDKRRDFLNPHLQNLADPLRLPDMEEAVRRVEAAIQRGERILIYSDYDVDGMTSGALLVRFLRALGAQIDVFLPNRMTEGYGLTMVGLERALSECMPQLLLALDCGTTSWSEVEFLLERGVDVVVMDHHELPTQLPRVHALVNPQSGQEDRSLASVGLVFKFCHALLKLRGDAAIFNLKDHLDLVALGTVADLVPLQDDNRILVRQGLKKMGDTNHIGLRALMSRAGVRGEPTPSTCGFILGPRLNASGRMAHGKTGLELLTTEDRALARRIVEELEHLNRKRQQIEQAAVEEAEEWLEGHFSSERDLAIVVASREWHQGVVGIVASRLMRKYYRPAVVIAIDASGKGKGSCRSIVGCSMMDALRACENLLEAFGGHAMAAGVELFEDRVDDFRNALNDWLSRNVAHDSFQPSLDVDEELRGHEWSEELARTLGQMEPFGCGNPAPVFVMRSAMLISEPKVFGRSHLSFNVDAAGQRVEVTAFKKGDRKPPARTLDLAGHWEMDDYTGRPRLRMLDWAAT